MTQNPYTPSGASVDPLTPGLTPAAENATSSATSASPSGLDLSSGTAGDTYSSTDRSLTGTDDSTTTSARDEATSVASDAAESGKKVAGTAASEVKDVVGEARTQLSSLFEQVKGQATEQASGQSDRAVTGMRTLSDELRQMASSSGSSGIATDLAGQAADRVQSIAGWLEQRQPGEVLDEVRSYARRRPGTFLAAAALVGLIGGRLTRGLTAGSGDSSTSTTPSPVTPVNPVTPVSSTYGYAAPTEDSAYAASPATGPIAATPAAPVTQVSGRVDGVEDADLGQGLR